MECLQCYFCLQCYQTKDRWGFRVRLPSTAEPLSFKMTIFNINFFSLKMTQRLELYGIIRMMILIHVQKQLVVFRIF